MYELLLQPGHDEMRAHRSQQMVRARGARVFDRAYDAPINCSDISPWTLQLMNVTLTRRPVRSKSLGPPEEDPRNSSNLVRQRHDGLVPVHTLVERIEPRPHPILIYPDGSCRSGRRE